MSEEKIYSVHEYLDLVNSVVSEISVAVEGEVSSLKRHPSGHIYFDLCEVKNGEKAVFSCALWKFKAQYLSWELKEGEKVQITGYADVYKQSGRYTFKIDKISPVGEGALKQAFEKLKTELQEKGFFLEEHKKSLPLFPQNIAVITSKSGAAINDFTTHLGKFGIKINLLDCRVEGINAIDEIVNGISYLNRNFTDIDLVVLTRGGGSLESLQAFNSYEVAQAIFSSRIPILSAIGHEDDVTIADLVADRRASTPTDAGNVVVEGWRDAKNRIQLVSQNLSSKISNIIENIRIELTNSLKGYDRNFLRILSQNISHISDVGKTVGKIFSNLIDEHKQELKDSSIGLMKEFNWRLKNYRDIEANFKRKFLFFENKLFDKYENISYFDGSFDVSFKRMITTVKERLISNEKHLSLSDPALKLKQGYSIIRNAENKIIKKVEELNINDQLKLQISNGVVKTTVTAMERN